MKEMKVFLVKNYKKVSEDPMLKAVGFSIENAKSLGVNEDGFFLMITADRELLEKCEVLKQEGKEITGRQKEEIIKKFKELEEKKAEGIGFLGI
ncbi:MAG: hypothetical protein QXX71_00715 [Candidatus Nanoarchaeia archaeon]|nr:hypothetical protein [Candidatus Haiyanarchaeum thermophilum]MCW1303043.1 hypothetical protein [Candidatus Haiyanarchaeum thermophilum]MCW1304138.1 hypothetical protein [Candidatus Haiyanarchaeum thermophilum]MCW1306847.1 hypothetical protein [Candidatus Haiyanarchaeum thermophilum]MCW1307089.1 hypothetical protein [Candidatus Haiyanarchaeum thermophilum]